MAIWAIYDNGERAGSFDEMSRSLTVNSPRLAATWKSMEATGVAVRYSISTSLPDGGVCIEEREVTLPPERAWAYASEILVWTHGFEVVPDEKLPRQRD